MKFKSNLPLVAIIGLAAIAVALGIYSKPIPSPDQPSGIGLAKILELGSDSCASCKAMIEVLAKVKLEMGSKIEVARGA